MATTVRAASFSLVLVSVLLSLPVYEALPVCEAIEKCQYTEENQTYACSSAGCTEVPQESDLLHAIPDEARTIFLSHNLIKTVPKMPYKKAELIDLSYNIISTIEEQAFLDCENLEALDLTGNALSNITDKHFMGLLQLKDLYLGNNKLVYLESSLFRQHAPKLQVLDLRENLIQEIDHNALNDLKYLFSLQLGRNQIRRVHALNFRGLSMLKLLHLEHNQIEWINQSSFKDLHKLKVLELSSNRLNKLESHIFDGLTSLQRLHLGKNRLASIDSKLGDLGSLEEVYLNHNPLVEIPPKAFPESIREVFLEEMPELRVVRRYAFAALPHLTKVYIQGCPKLDEIDGWAFGESYEVGNSSLEVLMLRNNSLKTLYKGMVDWERLEAVSLSYNPWSCDCRLNWIHDVELPQQEKDYMICQEPSKLRGMRVSSKDGFTCSSHQRLGVALIAVVTVAFIVFSCFLCYKCRYRVFPCCSETPGQYKMMYKNEDEDVDEPDDDATFNPVEFKKIQPGTMATEPTQV